MVHNARSVLSWRWFCTVRFTEASTHKQIDYLTAFHPKNRWVRSVYLPPDRIKSANRSIPPIWHPASPRSSGERQGEGSSLPSSPPKKKGVAFHGLIRGWISRGPTESLFFDRTTQPARRAMKLPAGRVKCRSQTIHR